MIRQIDDSISVAPQITPADVAEIARAGFVAIVNNRPDDEEGGQPEGDAIRAAAEAAGLAYTAIPITHAGFSGNQVEAMVVALQAADGPVLAYCRSGTRSCRQTTESSSSVLVMLTKPGPSAQPGMLAFASRRETAYRPESGFNRTLTAIRSSLFFGDHASFLLI